MEQILQLKKEFLNPVSTERTYAQTTELELDIINTIRKCSVEQLSEIIVYTDNGWLSSLGVGVKNGTQSNLILEFFLYPNIIKSLIEQGINLNEQEQYKSFMILSFLLFADDSFMQQANKKYIRQTLSHLLIQYPECFLYDINSLNNDWFPQNYHLPISQKHYFFSLSKSNSQIGMQIILDILINEQKAIELIKVFANKEPLFTHLKSNLAYFADLYALFSYYPLEFKNSFNQLRPIFLANGEEISSFNHDVKMYIKHNIIELMQFINHKEMARELLFSFTQFEHDIRNQKSTVKNDEFKDLIIQQQNMRLINQVFDLFHYKIVDKEIFLNFYQQQPIFAKYLSLSLYKDVFNHAKLLDKNTIDFYLEITQFIIYIQKEIKIKLVDIQDYLHAFLKCESINFEQKEKINKQLMLLN
jgi:hypothetical protein